MTGFLNMLSVLAGALNRVLGIFTRKMATTDVGDLAANIWEGYAPNWTPQMVGLGLIVMVAAIVAAVVSVRKRRHTGAQAFFGVLLVFYLYLMYGSTVFTRTPGTVSQANTNFLWEYRRMINGHSWYFAKQIGLNILMFVPIGVLYPLWRGRRCFWPAMIFGLICTCAIEIMQYVFKCGLFEFDDIFNNMLGMFIGYMVIRLFLPKHKARKRRRPRD